MADLTQLAEQIQQRFGAGINATVIRLDELTLEVSANALREVCLSLRDDPAWQFNLLVDICGVDYQDYGQSAWRTNQTTSTGFSRAVTKLSEATALPWDKPRFAVVYHLLSITLNQRLRLRVFPAGDPPLLDSVLDIWPAADWFEREAFDLYGILFDGHPDLRRLLTDYGFIGHPFRKDFPLIGTVEMRYDAALGRCVYAPVSIQPRTLVPKVIRQDNRYLQPDHEDKKDG